MLLEELAKLSTSQKIKVGAKNRFFFCGTVAEFCANIENYSAHMREVAMKTYLRAEKTRNKKIEHPPTLTRYIVSELKEKTPNPTIEAYNKLVERWFVDCEEAERFYAKTKAAYEEFKDLQDRVVEDVFDSAYDKDTKAIVLEGEEIGLFWDFSEVADCPFGIVGGKYEPDRQDA